MGYGVTQDMSKAEEEFKTAVSQSVTLYYYYDSIGSGGAHTPLRYPLPPKRLQTLPMQNGTVLRMRTSWMPSLRKNSLRRFSYQPRGMERHPPYRLSLRTNISRSIGTIPRVPNRWRYPSTEVNYNPYYKDVADKDTYTEKLFWAK